jgi:hypothetical protein
MCVPFFQSCEPLSLQLGGAMLYVLLSAACFFVGLFAAARLIDRPYLSWVRTPLVVLAALAGLVLLLIAGFLSPVTVPRSMTEIGIVVLFFALLLVILIYLLYGPNGRLILWTLLGFALFGAIFGTNDNHQIRLVNNFAPIHPSLESDFRTWLDTRQDRERYSSTLYPVYIVAAEGGGIYAAYHAAAVLARLQDKCPNFAQHVFAISSVSGGSFGAAVFAGLSEKMARNVAPAPCQSNPAAGRFERDTDRLFTEDHLSPAIWGFLFPDFVQRFIPFPFPSLDRARWLERSFEFSWWNIVGSPYFDQPFLRRYRPQGAAPALFMNTTDVRTGQRIVLTGYELDRTAGGAHAPDGVKTINSLIDPTVRDLRVSTAAGLSARFPVISPAGSVPNRPERLVDGGYFENSGVETALELIRALKAIAGSDRIAIRLIVLQSTADEQPSRAFSEVFDPVHAMLNTRVTRGTLARIRAWRELCKACAPVTIWGDAVLPRTVRGHPPAPDSLIWHALDGSQDPLPLGWHLGRVTQDMIRAQIGGTRDCMAGQDVTALNNCLFSQIMDELERGVAP